MSTRAATILAIAAVVSSLCYAGVAQVPEPERKATDGAIVVGQPAPGPELPGRYQVGVVGTNTVIVIDTHTGQCWRKVIGQSSWHDLGSPVEKK